MLRRLRENNANKMLSLVLGRKWESINVTYHDAGDRGS